MPGLRRLRDPRRDAGLHARARARAGEDRLRLGHRLCGALPVLHAVLRDALDPRSRARDRNGPRDLALRSLCVGRDRRRRRPLDRRQPPDPRTPSQRERQDPDVQQRDLRADEGPVLADVSCRQAHGVDADGLDRQSVQSAEPRDRHRRDVRRAGDRHRPQGADRGAACGSHAQGRRVRRDLPELQHLQRRRVRRGARGQDEPHLSPSRRAGPLRRGRRARRAAARGRLRRGLRRRRRGTRLGRSPPGAVDCLRDVALDSRCGRRGAVRRLSGRRSGPSTTSRWRSSSSRLAPRRARATSPPSSPRATRGRSASRRSSSAPPSRSRSRARLRGGGPVAGRDDEDRDDGARRAPRSRRARTRSRSRRPTESACRGSCAP